MTQVPPNPDEEYYYDLSTGQVAKGKQGSWFNRVGPYPSQEAAAKALETAKQRSADWDAEDEAWNEDWTGPTQSPAD